MIRLVLFLVAVCAAAAEMTLSPALITQCIGGLGQATITWQNAGPRLAQVRIFGPAGPPMTGWYYNAGSATTGAWVADRMAFVLVDQNGAELARVIAHVHCNAVVDPPANTSFWPLAAGNRWVFQMNTRVSTGAYEHWRVIENVEENVEQNGRIYTRVQVGSEEWLLREDEQNRLYRLFLPATEKLWLDPNQPPSPDAVLQIIGRGPIGSPVGDFPNAISYSYWLGNALLMETGQFIQGVGPGRINQDMVTGSSGGFFRGGLLVEAFVNGRLWTRPGTRVQLMAESTQLDVSGKNVTNCIVPCYFTACGLAPGMDPPGTYKPCFETSVAVERVPADADALLELLDSTGYPVLSQKLPVGTYSTFHYQAPLYTKPNVPYLPGNYLLRVRVHDDQGTEIGTASLPLRID